MRKALKTRGVCIIIPTFNNAGTVVDVVKGCQEYCDDVIVVCDGCTDNTVALLEAMNTRPTILDFKTNRGKGAALKEGFRHAADSGFTYAITIDADGQHFPQDIPLLVRASRKNPKALIIGKRQGLGHVKRSMGSRFANKFADFWFFIQTGRALKDTQSGFRLYPLKQLHGWRHMTSRYESELELLVFSSWHGTKLVEETVRVYYPPEEERVSHFRPARDFGRISLLNTALCFLAIVYGLPLRLYHSSAVRLRFVCYGLRLCAAAFFKVSPKIMRCKMKYKDGLNYRDELHEWLKINAAKIISDNKLPGLKFSMSNESGEDFSKPAVIISNHQSLLDLVPMLACHDKLVVITTEWVYDSMIFGYVVKNLDFIPVRAGIESMLSQVGELVRSGYSIVIYPEGTRSDDCSIKRFHKGAFAIARKYGLDMVPTMIYGTGHALPKSCLAINRWNIHFDIGRRIPCHELSALGDTDREQAAAMRDIYRKRYSELADKMDRYA